ncbi:MAG: ACR3 family arsenite efflux transporter [Deltaproteobacteria bacterium]|nr:ACR3 family arsenite efflux transporter [Deltaproteobacteria bacterium]
MSNPLGVFGQYLSVWVGLSIAVGVGLGAVFPGAFEAIAAFEFASVNLVVAVFIWVMIYPMMVQVDLGCLRDVGRRPGGLALTLTINWLVKPFTMALLAWVFFKGVFADFVTPEDADQYIAGMILLGVAPCTAMVFVWSQLSKGDPNYTLVQVSVNDLIMVFAFAPLAGLLLGVSDVIVPWSTLILSVVLFVVIPLVAGVATRALLLRQGRAALDGFNARLKPAGIVGLLATVVLIFGLQAPTILAKPGVIVLISVPLLIQSYGIFVLAYGLAWVFRVRHEVAAPAAMIGTSNFFELAVAVAISLFGLRSGAALATVVGVLIEVPVMLSLVAVANRTRPLFAARSRG